MEHTEMLAAQRKTPLQAEQRQKYAGQQRPPYIVHQWNFWHFAALLAALYHRPVCTGNAGRAKAAQQPRTPKRGRHCARTIVACVLECAGAPALLKSSAE